MAVDNCKIERRADGVLLVRVPSENRNGHTLPDAVFSFRAGDPQFRLWEQRWQEQQPALQQTSAAPRTG